MGAGPRMDLAGPALSTSGSPSWVMRVFLTSHMLNFARWGFLDVFTLPPWALGRGLPGLAPSFFRQSQENSRNEADGLGQGAGCRFLPQGISSASAMCMWQADLLNAKRGAAAALHSK